MVKILSGCCRCQLCGELVTCGTGPEFDEGICVNCMAEIASPKMLRVLADYFDSPSAVKQTVSIEGVGKMTAGMALRAIADSVVEIQSKLKS